MTAEKTAHSTRPMPKLMAFIAAGLIALGLSGGRAEAEPLKPGRSIRYTSGTVTVRGWEKELVEADPNLKRYYWGAMTSMKQSYKHVPLPVPARQGDAVEQPLRPLGSIYKKPVHVALPANSLLTRASTRAVVAARRPRPNNSVFCSLDSTSVSATLSVPAAVSARPTIATYGNLLPAGSTVRTSGPGGMASAEVRGTLLR